MRRILFVSSILSCLITLSAQDWNQWRGPQRKGMASGFTAPAAWPERPARVWKIQAGEGHSSPVVSAGRVYLLSRIGENEAATAYDLASGKQVWRQTYAAPYQMNPAATGHGKGPKSTPLIHRGHLYTLGIAGTLSAFDPADGRVLWRKDFKKEFPSTSPDFGAAMSPIGDGTLIIAHVGGAKNGALTAFDADTGNPKWSWKGDGPGYASPVVAPIGGTRQLITQTQSQLVGVSLADGRLLWSVPFTTEFDQNIVTPVVADDLVVYAGVQKPTTAVRVTTAAGKWTTTQVWQNADIPMYMSSPVEAGGLLFGLTQRNRGQLFCVDLRTGRTLWTGVPRQGENASLVAAGDVLMVTTTEGELAIVRMNPKTFDLVRKYTIAESPVWAHPAPAGKGVVIKDADTLAYWTF